MQVRELCEAAGVTLDVSSNRALAASLEAACSASPQAASLIRSLTTRAMSEAEYCSTGNTSCCAQVRHKTTLLASGQMLQMLLCLNQGCVCCGAHQVMEGLLGLTVAEQQAGAPLQVQCTPCIVAPL